jgi:26S proteasome non-ATPase regulatory subunit 10
MEVAAEHARKGDLGYFVEGKGSAQLPQLVKRRDEDGRSLLHSAAASGNLQLAQLIADAGGPDLLTVTDDEVMHTQALCCYSHVQQHLGI